jgi:hypothetical protein
MTFTIRMGIPEMQDLYDAMVQKIESNTCDASEAQFFKNFLKLSRYLPKILAIIASNRMKSKFYHAVSGTKCGSPILKIILLPPEESFGDMVPNNVKLPL